MNSGIQNLILTHSSKCQQLTGIHAYLVHDCSQGLKRRRNKKNVEGEKKREKNREETTFGVLATLNEREASDSTGTDVRPAQKRPPARWQDNRPETLCGQS